MTKTTFFNPTRRLTACIALAMSVASVTTMVAPANAAMKHHRHMARMGKFTRAHQRPDYVGAPGFAGGPAVSMGPSPTMPMGTPGLLGNGGLVGSGILPQTGIFTGVPLLGSVGL